MPTQTENRARICPRCRVWREAHEYSAPYRITTCRWCEDALRMAIRRCPRCDQYLPGAAFTVGGTGRWCRRCAREARQTRAPRLTERTELTELPEPGWLTRRFGVELEWSHGATPQGVVRELRARGLRARHEAYNHHTRGYWKVVSDSSCGWELVSPPLSGADGLRQLRLASEALRAAGARVTRSCGTHVHLDARGETLDSIKAYVLMYVDRQDLIDQLVARSRRGGRNPFCRRWGQSLRARLENMTDLRSWYREDRYYTLNVAAYARHGTIENRQHQGTIDADKVEAWVELNMRLWDAAKQGRDVSKTDLWQMLRDLGMDDDRVAWWQQRYLRLAR